MENNRAPDGAQRGPVGDCLPVHRWYALHVRSRTEKSVSAQLEAKQYKVFLPLYLARHKWADRWKTLPLPLFPGYVFCWFDAATRSSVLATSGVIDIVRGGSEPAPIETGEIDAIRSIVNSRLVTEPYPGLVKGQRVVLRSGPLSGLSGTLFEIRKRTRLAISVEILQRSVLVEVEHVWAAPCVPGRSIYSATSFQVA